MAVYNASLVNIPDDGGVHVKSAGAKCEKYVYKYVKYFRNEEGKPRNMAKAIGKFDPVSGKMYPNSNYFDLYNVDQSFADITVWDYGYSYLTARVSRDTGLLDCLSRAFGEKCAMDIVVMASYMIREGSTMDGIDDWQQRNYFPDCPRIHTSQSTSRIFASMTAGQIRNFFTKWVKATMGKDGCACYDVTSVSSYAQSMTSVERGYNRDGEDLAQFNLGLFCDEIEKLPLYYNRYNGSLTDRTNLEFVLANARDVGIKRVKMVVDGGFWDENCLASLHGLCDAFTVGMPAYLVESRALLASHGADIANYANELSSPGVYCALVDFEVGSIAGRALLYFDSQNHVSLCGELSERINRLKSELAALKRYPKSKLNRYTPYFALTRHENDSGFDFEVDVEKVEKARKGKGYFLIFSTDSESSPEDILYHYRAKDAAEKMFSQIKCDMEGNRIRTHNEQTTDGKTFVTFIACVIRSYMLNKLGQYLTDNSTSLKKALNQLSNVAVISSAGGFRFTKALSKKQKQILKVFGADGDITASLR